MNRNDDLAILNNFQNKVLISEYPFDPINLFTPKDSFKPSFLLISAATNIKLFKILQSVSIAHPKRSIISVKHRVDNSFNLISPQRRTGAPVPSPFEAAPRVPNIQDPITKYFDHRNNRVRVSRNKTSSSPIACFSRVINPRSVNSYQRAEVKVHQSSRPERVIRDHCLDLRVFF